MIEITERPILEAEKEILRQRIPDKDKRAENALMAFIIIAGILLLPLLAIDKYIVDVPSTIQLITLVPIICVAAYLAYRLDKTGNDSPYLKTDIEAGVVTVYHVKTDKVIKREDPEDFGLSYYFDLGPTSEYKTLFLFGQYLEDDLDEHVFPCTEFQLIKGKSGQVIDLIPSGVYLKPFKTLEAYSKKDFKEGKVPDDGQLLTVSIDDILRNL